MGGALSHEEEKQLVPHLENFEPDSLSSVIWDTINLVGVDDERDNFGIHFDAAEESQAEGVKEEDKEQNVVFWDGDEAQDLPLPVFMDIIVMVGEATVKRYEENYNLEENKEVEAGVNKLKLAMEYLQRALQVSHRPETLGEYRNRIDSMQSISSRKQTDRKHLVQSARERRGSHTWSAGELDPPNISIQKQRSIENITPQLWRQYDMSEKSKTTLQRVKNKLKVLSLFHTTEEKGAIKELQDKAHSELPPSPTQESIDSFSESASTNRTAGSTASSNC